MVFHPLIIYPSHTSQMIYNYQIQNILKQYTCAHTHVCVYLLHEYMNGSRNFRQGAQLIEKNPNNILVLNLFYSGAQWLFQRNYFFYVQTGEGAFTNIRGSNLFHGDRGQNAFSIETYRTRCFPGVSRLPAPPPPLDSRIAYVHVSMFVAF